MSIVAWHGTSAGYTEHPLTNKVIIERFDGNIIRVSRETFDHLYFRLDKYTAALKDDCIEFVEYIIGKPYDQYPEWFMSAVSWGYILDVDGVTMFYDTCGEVAMSPQSIVLKNFMGELAYMEPDVFEKYYDTTPMGGLRT